MNQQGFANDKEMMEACVEALRQRELAAQPTDGPTSDELKGLLAMLNVMFESEEDAFTLPFALKLETQLLCLPNKWLFPELDPVAKLIVPYLAGIELNIRRTISEHSPHLAENLQSIASMSIVVKAASRLESERKDKRARIISAFRRFLPW